MSKTVLCRLPNHVGDCMMTLPALQLLADSGFTPSLIGKRFAEDLMAGLGWRYDPIEGQVLKDLGRVKEIARSTGDSPRGVLFPNSFGSALLFKLGGIRSAGYPTDGRGFLLDARLAEPGVTHEVNRFFTVAREAIIAWGGTPARDKPTPQLGLKLLARHRAGARNILRDNHITEDQKFVLLAPVARGLHKGQKKSWDHFDSLAKYIEELGYLPLALPSPHEVEEVRVSCPSARILEPTTLGTYAALCERASLVIANDSGISHVAAGIGARQITLIGVTDPTRTGPWNPAAVTLGSEGHWPTEEEVKNTVHRILTTEA